MKLKLSFVALAALAMSAAHAGTPLTPAQAAAAAQAGNAIYVSGSSALRFSMAAGFLQACDTSTVAVFGNGSGAVAAGNNVRAYACTLASNIAPTGGATAFTQGTNVVFSKYDQGGSINGVQPLVLNTALSYLNFGACTSTGLVRSGNFDLTQMDYACSQGNLVVPQMGVSDVEAATLQNTKNLPAGTNAVSTSNLTGGVHSVAMGAVAVNLVLYRALQVAQGLAQDDAPAHAPSLPISFLTTVETGNASPLTGTGWNELIPSDGSGSATDSANQSVLFCSRTNGSGTKAMHNAFLLGTPCTGVGATPVGGTGASQTALIEAGNGDFFYQLNSSTGNVVSCLAAANTSTVVTTDTGTSLHQNWAVGMIGAEQSPFNAAGTTDAGWRLVAVSGAYPSRANAQIGAYPMTFENYMYWPKSLSGAPAAFAKWLQSNAVNPAALQAASLVDPGTGQGILSSTAIDITQYTAPASNFVAKVTRNGSSCAPQVIVQ